MMGDNRDDSLDSRFSPYDGGIGLVPIDHLVGRASARFWSTDGSAEWLKPWTWFTALRGDRIGGDLRPMSAIADHRSTTRPPPTPSCSSAR